LINKRILKLLKSPGDLKPLHELEGRGLGTEDGREFPILDGILCLLNEEERDSDLGDGRFYDDNPFGERNWSDQQDVTQGVEKELKDLLNEFPKESLVADIGSGPGRISNFLSLAGYESVVSLDYSLASLKQVKNNSINTCIWGNNLHLPFAQNSFDLVISSGVVHHTPDPHKAISECIRVLKPGGSLYLRVYNIHSLYAYLHYSYGWMLRALNTKRSTEFLAEILGFRIYKFIRRFMFMLPDRDNRILRAKFSNLFTKEMVYFFSSAEIRHLMNSHGLDVTKAHRQGYTHRI